MEKILRDFEDTLIKILHKLYFLFSDKQYIKLRWRIRMKHRLNLENPKTFCEKIQWLKLYHRKPEYTEMVDKYAVKEYVAKKIGEEFIIPTIALWKRPEDIDWNTLPDSFVLKTTHGGGSGGVVICKNKAKLNKEAAIKKLKKSYRSDIYKTHREWPYKNVPKQVIAEVLMEDNNSINKSQDLSDYKFFCFNGEPWYCQVIRDRSTKETIDFYDMQWKHMPFVGLNPRVPNGTTSVPKPSKLDKMIDICRKLSDNIPFVRIDLYLINDKIYFGEITFYPATGIGRFKPQEWDFDLGKLLILPN